MHAGVRYDLHYMPLSHADLLAWHCLMQVYDMTYLHGTVKRQNPANDNKPPAAGLCVYVCVCVCVCVYRERARERREYMYIYAERERERESGWRESIHTRLYC